jgi:hypothetical protein
MLLEDQIHAIKWRPKKVGVLLGCCKYSSTVELFGSEIMEHDYVIEFVGKEARRYWVIG